MPIELVRRAVNDAVGPLERYRHRQPNPGLVIRRGLSQLDDAPAAAGRSGSGEAKAALIKVLAELPASEGYRWAYRRWVEGTTGPGFDARELALEGRLYIGVSRDNPLETGVSVAHAWGMPIIAGSALKGVARKAARLAGMDAETEVWLFGQRPPEGADAAESDSEAGIAVFHDAWWCPNPGAKPFVAEVVTPHHRDYYDEGKGEATDFDSPVPAPQIAVAGAFRFVVGGPDGWRELAMGMLTRALTQGGVGGKTTSGYGLFRAPSSR